MKKLKAFVKNRLNWALQNLFACTGETIKDVLKARSVLVIAPHPDDETLACGGTIALLREAGARVRLVIVTGGDAAGNASAKNLARIRQVEAQKAARQLGVSETDIVFLSYPDTKASEQIEAIAKDLAAQIWLCSPEIIFSPYEIDEHEDHRAVAQAVEELSKAGKITARILSYPVWFWPRGAVTHLRRKGAMATHRRMDIAPVLGKKKAAFAFYVSQKEGEAPVLSETFLQTQFRPFELFFEK